MPAAKRARGGATAAGAAAAAVAQPQPNSTPRHGGLTAVHRSRLVDWAVAPVAAIAPCPDGAHVAVGYGDGSVELWDARAGFCRLARIPGEDGAELSALAWVPDALAAVAPRDDDDDEHAAATVPSAPLVPALVSAWRLFAARLDGTIREVFPAALDPGGGLHSSASAAAASAGGGKSAASGAASHHPSCVTDSYGGAVWALAAEPPAAVRAGFAAHLAAACDDGSVRLFAVEPGEPGLQYVGVVGRAAGEASADKRAAAALAGRKRRGDEDDHDHVDNPNAIRCLSVAWHPSGAAVVAGCSDGLVRAWDAGPALGGPSSASRARGRELLRVSVGASSVAAAGPPCVWAVAVLPDGVLVTGASDGAVCFFEPRSGALLSRHARHHADVLSLAVAPDGNGVYAAGVDARVALYARVGGGGGQQQQGQQQQSQSPQQQQQQPRQWQYLDYKAPHSHDVRALAVLLPPSAGAAAGGDGGSAGASGRRGKRRGGSGKGPSSSSSSGSAGDLGSALLFSGGADGQVMAYGASRQRFLKEHPARLTKAPQAPLVALAPASAASTSPAARLLSVRGRQADVWQLGVAYAQGGAADPWQQQQQQQQQQQPHNNDEGAPLELASAPRHLARLVASGPQHVAAAAISPDGQLVALSDPASGVRVYRLVDGGEGGAVAVSRVRLAARPRLGTARSGQADPSLLLPPAGALAFVPNDPRTLVCADGSGVLRAVSLKGAMPGDEVEQEEESEGEQGERVVGTVVATSPARHAPPALASGGAYAALGMRPAVSHLAISPDGAWVAAATAGGAGGTGGGGGKGGAPTTTGPSAAVELFSLPGLKPHGPLLLVDPLAMPQLSEDGEEAAAEAGDNNNNKRRKGGNSNKAPAAASALPPVAALAFSPDSQTLVVATAGNAVAAYDVRSGAPTSWTRRYAAAAAELLGTLPGAVAGVSFCGGVGFGGGGDGGDGGNNSNSSKRASMVVYSPGGVAALDLGAPVGVGHLRGGGGGSAAAGRQQQQQHRHRRGAAKPPREGPGSAGVPPGASARGANGRVLLLENPCLFFGHSSPDEALLLEKPLSSLLERLPAPLQRARYGS